LAGTACLDSFSVLMYCIWATGLSAVVCRMTWTGNDLANFDEIWQLGPFWVPVVHCRELAPSLLSNLATVRNSKMGTACLMLRLLELSLEGAEFLSIKF